MTEEVSWCEGKLITKTKAEWEAEGKELFGEDMLQWEFVCPSCKNVQKPEDFRKYKDRGATPNTAMFNCIGRYDGHGDNDMCAGKQPCNYTSGGLLMINPVCVIDEEGKKHYIFDFNREKNNDKSN